ncbi:hypothetical protein [Roseibium sp. RKSG952]|uniref:hypothetical protein n=1 Tax=Roseibium sp. RKSG952 TaxID=2529384 RepID=UPI0012BD08D3|nr:hypothetical protein [Roseibium sp. RKSG952]MTH99760.1 hypothetical protein [Roseibium sp. RKSG952]
MRIWISVLAALVGFSWADGLNAVAAGRITKPLVSITLSNNTDGAIGPLDASNCAGTWSDNWGNLIAREQHRTNQLSSALASSVACVVVAKRQDKRGRCRFVISRLRHHLDGPWKAPSVVAYTSGRGTCRFQILQTDLTRGDFDVHLSMR